MQHACGTGVAGISDAATALVAAPVVPARSKGAAGDFGGELVLELTHMSMSRWGEQMQDGKRR